jgi:hypothetical protein
MGGQPTHHRKNRLRRFLTSRQKMVSFIVRLTAKLNHDANDGKHGTCINVLTAPAPVSVLRFSGSGELNHFQSCGKLAADL